MVELSELEKIKAKILAKERSEAESLNNICETLFQYNIVGIHERSKGVSDHIQLSNRIVNCAKTSFLIRKKNLSLLKKIRRLIDEVIKDYVELSRDRNQ